MDPYEAYDTMMSATGIDDRLESALAVLGWFERGGFWSTEVFGVSRLEAQATAESVAREALTRPLG